MSTGKTYQLDILTNHVNSMYQIGEPVVFSPSVGCDSICLYRGSVEWKISTDDSIVLKTGKADLALPGDSAEIILGHPGFVVCECVFKPEDADPVSAKHGVAVGACKIMPSMAAPADFDAFWELQKRRLSDIPMTCEIKKLPSPHVNLFDVKISCLDKIPASGLLALPRNCPPKSCPAFIFLHGAGVYTSSHATPVQLAMSGYMAMDLNAHGLPNLMEPEYYIGKSKGELFEYVKNCFDRSPEDVYFKNMFMRVKRAIEFIAERPEWDGKNIFLQGHSQGAYQCIAGAYLDKRVSAIACGVPAGCDLTGSEIGRAIGWPSDLFEPESKNKSKILNTARYFDNVNFASKIKVPGIFSCGFVDTACKPTTVYAMYNNYAGPKKIICRPRMGHEAPREITEQFLDFLIGEIT